ncbi:hypothetical protein KC19_7G136600 [Ceratodon purpureus]|uniref:DUF1995 domain-containing protein n=1 Tax=Ceratodon purpureus TaxID=3225 RepID=A0A8T0HEJ8_CERPU|nr:hypothetical protein KC19_7G136600 [Ceratodon purpureus]
MFILANSVRKMANPSSLLLKPNGVGAGSQFRIQSRESCRLQCRAFVCHSLKPHERIPGLSARPSGWSFSTTERLRFVRIRCSASGGEVPPESREEAIEQAAGSVAALLEKVLKRRGPSTVKQRKEQRQVKLRVEIPVLDDAPSSLASLTLDLVSALLRKSRDSPDVAVFFSGASPVELARDQCANREVLNVSFHSLQSERDVSGDVAVVLVAGARYEDNECLQELARNVTPRPVVVLNPEWSPEDEKDARWGSFLASFEAAYAFIPLAIQGLFSKTEGAVLKNVQSGAPGGRPWLIFVKEDGKFTRLSTLKGRPGPAELESALYNAMAANSPVTKSIKFLRGLVSKE